jgi:hypothetical protein
VFIDKFFTLYGQIFLLEFCVIILVWLLSWFLSSRRFIGKENFS